MIKFTGDSKHQISFRAEYLEVDRHRKAERYSRTVTNVPINFTELSKLPKSLKLVKGQFSPVLEHRAIKTCILNLSITGK